MAFSLKQLRLFQHSTVLLPLQSRPVFPATSGSGGFGQPAVSEAPHHPCGSTPPDHATQRRSHCGHLPGWRGRAWKPPGAHGNVRQPPPPPPPTLTSSSFVSLRLFYLQCLYVTPGYIVVFLSGKENCTSSRRKLHNHQRHGRRRSVKDPLCNHRIAETTLSFLAPLSDGGVYSKLYRQQTDKFVQQE